MSKSRAPSFSKAGQRGVLAEDRRRRRVGESRAEAHAARDSATIHQSGRASPGGAAEGALARDAALGIGDGAVLLAPGGGRQQRHGRTRGVGVAEQSETTTNGQRPAPRARVGVAAD